MALTRIKDSMSGPKRIHQVEVASVVPCSFAVSRLFAVNGNVTSSWIIDFTDVPTSIDDMPNFAVEIGVFWNRATGGALPTFRVNGSTVSPTTQQTSTTNGSYITKALITRRSGAWALYVVSGLESAFNPAFILL